VVFLRWAADVFREEIRILASWLADFCRRWKVVELCVFGSALRVDFQPDSDLDLLVSSPRCGLAGASRQVDIPLTQPAPIACGEGLTLITAS
jgi:hypothetical protein